MTQKLIKRLRAFSFSYQYTRKVLTSSTMAGKNPNPTLHQMMTLLRYGVSYRAYAVSLIHVDTATISTISTSISTSLLANFRRTTLCACRRGTHGKRPIGTRPACRCQTRVPQTSEGHPNQPSRSRWSLSTSRIQRCDMRFLPWTEDIKHCILSQLSSHFPIKPEVMHIFYLHLVAMLLNRLRLGHA